MKCGRIELYDWNDVLLTQRVYWSVQMRKDIVNEWRKRYGNNMKKCYLQITPRTSPFEKQKGYAGLHAKYKRKAA